jgi:tungstate transport system ATP-binding protein
VNRESANNQKRPVYNDSTVHHDAAAQQTTAQKRIVQASNITVVAGNQTICRVEDFQAFENERISIIGPNGSGKSTFLRLLGALCKPKSGELQIDVPRLQRTMVHQSPYLFKGSVYANIAYGLKAQGVPKNERKDIIADWLDRLNISHLLRRRVGRLSGGERRRVALARACAIGPRLLLLDEPFSDLDQNGCSLVCKAIDSMNNVTVIIASPTPVENHLPCRLHPLAAENS